METLLLYYFIKIREKYAYFIKIREKYGAGAIPIDVEGSELRCECCEPWSSWPPSRPRAGRRTSPRRGGRTRLQFHSEFAGTENIRVFYKSTRKIRVFTNTEKESTIPFRVPIPPKNSPPPLWSIKIPAPDPLNFTIITSEVLPILRFSRSEQNDTKTHLPYINGAKINYI